jgi:hypothetical protein
VCFDRYDIETAYYLYAMLHHEGQWSKEYALFATLNRIGYSPPRMLSGPDDLNRNAREIYDRLVSGETEIRDRR